MTLPTSFAGGLQSLPRFVSLWRQLKEDFPASARRASDRSWPPEDRLLCLLVPSFEVHVRKFHAGEGRPLSDWLSSAALSAIDYELERELNDLVRGQVKARHDIVREAIPMLWNAFLSAMREVGLVALSATGPEMHTGRISIRRGAKFLTNQSRIRQFVDSFLGLKTVDHQKAVELERGLRSVAMLWTTLYDARTPDDEQILTSSLITNIDGTLEMLLGSRMELEPVFRRVLGDLQKVFSGLLSV